MLDWKRTPGNDSIGTILLGFLWWSAMIGIPLAIVVVAVMLVFTYPILILFAFIWFMAQRSE